MSTAEHPSDELACLRGACVLAVVWASALLTAPGCTNTACDASGCEHAGQATLEAKVSPARLPAGAYRLALVVDSEEFSCVFRIRSSSYERLEDKLVSDYSILCAAPLGQSSFPAVRWSFNLATSSIEVSALGIWKNVTLVMSREGTEVVTCSRT